MAKNPHFYFLSDQYFIDFPDPGLMKNYPPVNGTSRNRPYFFGFQDNKNPDIYWMIPVSSKDKKYASIMQKKIAKYGSCDTIRIEKLFNKNCAFLIQNMCPATSKYLTPYIDKKNQPVCINNKIAASLITDAKDVLEKVNHGMKAVFPDVFKIYKELETQVKQQSQQQPIALVSGSGSPATSQNNQTQSTNQQPIGQPSGNGSPAAPPKKPSFKDVADRAKQRAAQHNASISQQMNKSQNKLDLGGR